jgi:molybdopterin-guanine dinucleotide biosynthesis protein MobB
MAGKTGKQANGPTGKPIYLEVRYMSVPVVSVVAKSGTGKTTLLEKLIRVLKQRGYRVGAIKHDAHRFDIDREGKDSWRLTQAGADTMVISSPAKLAMVKQHTAENEPGPADIVAAYFGDVDIVLTEGYKKNTFPKIEVHRSERSHSLLCRGDANDPMLMAVASDETLELDVPVFNIDDPEGICDLIENRFFSAEGK